MEKDEKFPVNSASVAGVIVRVVADDSKHRANVTVLTSSGEQNQFINVLVSGEQRYTNFMEEYAKAEKGLANEEKKNPLVKFSGEAYFSSNEYNGVKNQNFTLIASGINEDGMSNKKFVLTKTPEERDAFRKEFSSNNKETNQVQIRANLTSDPKLLTSNKGKEFASVNAAHNYVYKDKSGEMQKAVMYAAIVIPSVIVDRFKKDGLTKGDPIQLSGNVQNNSFENQNGEKVYSFNIIASSVSLDIQVKNVRDDKKEKTEMLETSKETKTNVETKPAIKKGKGLKRK